MHAFHLTPHYLLTTPNRSPTVLTLGSPLTAKVASAKLAQNPTGPDAVFYQGKINTGKFYFAYLLPRAESHLSTMLKGPQHLMKITEEQLSTR